MNYYDDFIKAIHEELGEEAGYSFEYLANWFAGNWNLGKLNNLIGTCFSGSYATGEYGEIISYSIEPELGGDERAIYQKIFEIEFYNKQARSVLKSAAGFAGGDWTSLKEGDSSITRVNRNDVARNYKQLAESSKKELDSLAQSYLKFRAFPQQVVGDDNLPGMYYRGVSSDYGDYRSDRDYIY